MDYYINKFPNKKHKSKDLVSKNCKLSFDNWIKENK